MGRGLGRRAEDDPEQLDETGLLGAIEPGEAELEIDRARRVRRPMLPGFDQGGRLGERPAAVAQGQRLELVGTQDEPGDDAEAGGGAAAAQRPEQIGLLPGGGGDEAAVGEQHLHPLHLVGDEAVAAAEKAEAAGQSEAADRDQGAAAGGQRPGRGWRGRG